MKRDFLVLFLMAFFLSLQALASPADLTVKLGNKEASPESEAAVEVSLEGATDAGVGSVNLDVTFPKKLLTFIRAESKLKPEEFTLATSVDEGPAARETAVLKLTLSPAQKDAPKALSDGPVATLTFTVATDAEAGKSISLVGKAKVTTLESPPKSLQASAANGEIKVVPSLIFSCFFYMH